MAHWYNNKPFSEFTAPKPNQAESKSNAPDSSREKVRILHINIRSLRNKVEYVENFVVDQNIDVICLTEHWWNQEEINCLNIDGYKVAASYSRNN